MTTEIYRDEDCNEGIKEGRNGRTYTRSAARIIWVAVVDGNAIEAYDTLKEARKAYPNAKIIRD